MNITYYPSVNEYMREKNVADCHTELSIVYWNYGEESKKYTIIYHIL